MPFDPAAEGWKHFDTTGIAATIGPFWSRREGTGWVYGLLADERHANQMGLVHGGVLMTFIDNVMGATAWQAAERQPVVTLQLDTQFISPGKMGMFLVGAGQVVRITRSVIFLHGVVRCEGREIITATGIWKRLGTKAAADERPKGGPTAD
jgi:uncharacterized protein (TIGR00369 family)